ncbi:MAG: beta-ketoacyl synthase N-terminal-like domain-containing protein, partial [Acidobacteriota bacterium]
MPDSSNVSRSFTGTEIAVVGMAGRFPGARDTAELWRNLRAGVESIRRLEPDELTALGVAPELAGDPDWV